MRKQPWVLLAIVACLALGAWLSGLVSANDIAWITIATMVVGVVGQALLNRHTTARRWLLVASAGIAIAAFGVTFLEPGVVLALGGEEMTAVVTQVDGHHTGKGAYYETYALRGADGTPIPGQLFGTDSQTYRVGDHVTVLADVAGEANPEQPGDLDIVPWGIVSGVGLLIILVSLVVIGRAGEGPDEFWPMLLRVYGLGRDREPSAAAAPARPKSSGTTPGQKQARRRRRRR